MWLIGPLTTWAQPLGKPTMAEELCLTSRVRRKWNGAVKFSRIRCWWTKWACRTSRRQAIRWGTTSLPKGSSLIFSVKTTQMGCRSIPRCQVNLSSTRKIAYHLHLLCIRQIQISSNSKQEIKMQKRPMKLQVREPGLSLMRNWSISRWRWVTLRVTLGRWRLRVKSKNSKTCKEQLNRLRVRFNFNTKCSSLMQSTNLSSHLMSSILSIQETIILAQARQL